MKIIIAGGGTAGHVFPAIALGQELAARGADVSFIGADRGMERTLVPDAGFDLITLPTRPFKRSISLGALKAPFTLLSASRMCRSEVKDAAVVVGMGGYASAPALVSARRDGIPIVLHEQNAIPGAANRMFASQAAAIATTFTSSVARFGRDRTVQVTGNPVRRQIRDALADRDAVRTAAFGALGLDPDLPTVVVAGGSQGALHLDQVVTSAVPMLVEGGAQVLLLAGRAHAEEVTRRVEGRAVVLPFLDEMERAYAVGDLFVCRAGATTIAEASLWGIPMMLVPYPHATANHQEANARELERAGAATVVMDENLRADRLAADVLALLADTSGRRRMGDAAAAWSKPDAAQRLAAIVESVIR